MLDIVKNTDLESIKTSFLNHIEIKFDDSIAEGDSTSTLR